MAKERNSPGMMQKVPLMMINGSTSAGWRRKELTWYDAEGTAYDDKRERFSRMVKERNSPGMMRKVPLMMINGALQQDGAGKKLTWYDAEGHAYDDKRACLSMMGK